MTQELPGRKFKVCLITVSLAKGGAERSCAMLSRMLSAHGHEVHIAILNDEIGYPYAGKIFNLGKEKSKQESIFSRFLRIKRLRKYLKEQNIDVVIDQRPKNDIRREKFYDSYIYRNINRIYLTHSSKQDNYLTKNPGKFAEICSRNKANVAVSKYIETEVLAANGIGNHCTIHNAFDPQWMKDSTKGVAPYHAPYILSYGRINDRIKDFKFLIDSFDASNVHKTGYMLVIMGEGKDKKMLEDYASLKASAANIRFESHTENPFPLIRNASFITLTSRYEGFPMVLTESLSLGTPIVSLDIVSGPSEIVQHEQNGLLISERSIPLFAQAISRMVNDVELFARCEKYAKPSVAAFSMEEIGKKWHKLLNDVL